MSPLIIEEALTFLGIITLPRQTLQICQLIIPAVIAVCLYGPHMHKAAMLGTSGGEVNSHPKLNNVFFPLLAQTLRPRWYTAELAHSFSKHKFAAAFPSISLKVSDKGVW